MTEFYRARLGSSDDSGKEETARARESDGGPSPARTLPPGVVLGDRYEILRLLGVGGMSTVYLARDRRFTGADKLCAVKEMAEPATDEESKRESLRLFELEANTLASLSHPAIPKVYDFFSEREKAYLVLEYVAGTDLQKVIESSSNCLPEGDVVNWAIQICDVLTYLHTRKPDSLIFRDLKPSNIMLTQLGHIVLIDFGIAKVFQFDRKGTMVGTEGYAPPEQYKGIAEPRTDIYALGATMHHLLTNSDPRFEVPFTFYSRPSRKLNPKLSEAVEAVILRAVEYDLDKRFSTAEEMKRALLATTGKASESRSSSVGLTTRPGVPVQIAEPQVVWEFACQDEVRSTPLVVGGTIYVGSYDKSFRALDAETGGLKWSVPAAGGICGSACVLQESIVFGSEDDCIYSVHHLTGRLLWSYRTNGAVRSTPKAALGTIFVGSDDHQLHAIDGRLGRPVWRFTTWGPVRSSPVVGNGLVYVGSGDENVYAIDAGGGTMRWKFQTMGAIISSPAVTGHFVIIASVDRNVYALDATSGSVVWRMASDSRISSSPATTESLVLIGSADKSLYALDLYTGRVVWSFATEGPITSSPKVHGDAAYVGSGDGVFYSVEVATGKLRWKFDVMRAIPGSAAFGHGMVYFGGLDGKIYALLA